MSKILLTNLNTLWGVIKNPQSSDTYRHILSFENNKIKDEFINSKVFGDENFDYKSELDKQVDVALTEIDSQNANFQINIKDYANETRNSLLNKDFAIVKEDNQIRFYTLNGKVINTNIIEYDAELEIFFTHDVKDMFNNNKVKIKTSHYDRYKINGGKIEPNLSNWDTPLYNKEDFDNIDDESLFRDGNIEYNSYKDDDFVFDNKGDDLTDDEKKYFIELFSEYKYQIVYQNSKKGITPNYPEDTSQSPYRTLIGVDYESPLAKINRSIYKTIPSISIGTIPSDADYVILDAIKQITKDDLEDANIIKNAYTLSSLCPFYFKNSKIYIITNKQNGVFDRVGYCIVDPIYNPLLDYRPLKIWNEILEIDNNWTTRYNEIKSTKYNLKPFIDDLYNVDLNINNKRNDLLEIKSHFAPYTKITLSSSTTNKLNLLPQLFSKNEISIKSLDGLIMENWIQNSIIENYNKVNSNSEIPLDLNEYFVDGASYSLVTDTTQWNEFIASNKAQQNASFLSKGIGTGLGILGVVGSLFTGGASLGLGIAGLSVAGKSAIDINNQLAQRKDIKNSPDKINNTGSTLSFDKNIKELKPNIQRYSLSPIDMKLIRQHFYMYGINFNNQLFNINDILKTRYYFNHIEIDETFENIKTQLSSDIKQVINDTFSNGVTIWHIRDVNTFKGIKNYDYENVEMSVYNAQQVKVK